MATEKLRMHKSPGTDQIPAELIKQEVGQIILSSINLLIVLEKGRTCLSSDMNRSFYLFIRRVTVVSIKAYHFANYIQNFIQHPAVKINL
jgi:hypothetical protein